MARVATGEGGETKKKGEKNGEMLSQNEEVVINILQPLNPHKTRFD